MKQAIAEKWIKALYSGEYKQGFNYLKVKDRYCCLGVLCDIYQKETNIDLDFDGQPLVPSSVIKWAGMSYINGFLPDCPYGNSLAFLNDAAGLTFSQIADVIKENWVTL